MKPVLAMCTATRVTEDMDGYVAASNSNATEHKLQLLSKSVVETLPNTRGAMPSIDEFGVVVKTGDEAMVGTFSNKWNSTLNSQIAKTVESTLNDALQAR